MSLFLTAPKFNPAELLSPLEVQKLAGFQLNSPPSAWDDEIVQILLRDNPYIPANRVVINFKRKDDAQGTAVGYVGISGAPHISIPIVIRRRMLYPLDVMVLRSNNDTGIDQGIDDMSEDRVVPLNQQTFEQALDDGAIGEPVSEYQTRNTGYTEDGSALRLPFRGRTVIAEYMGVSKQKIAQFGEILKGDRSAVAGFMLNNTGDVVNSWLNAKEPAHTITEKIASTPVKLATANVLVQTPEEIKTAEFTTGSVYMSNGQAKIATLVDSIDLGNPSRGPVKMLIYEDGNYGPAPEKIAGHVFESDMAGTVLKTICEKLAQPSLQSDMTISFWMPEGVISEPAKVASITTQDGHIYLRMLDPMARSYNVVLANGVKTATLDHKTASWIIPAKSAVFMMGGYEQAPMEITKLASFIESQLPDEIICANGQFSLNIQGEAFATQQDETKIAAILNHWFDNGDTILSMVKQAAADNDGIGSLRFQSNIMGTANEVVKLASHLKNFPEIADSFIKDTAIPLQTAIKLAACVGDPDGVDAILGSGFLSEDNLAEFVNLSDEFKETVEKLARLLLAIRMGLRGGDETATMVAMKALQRVTERLQGINQEVGA